MPTGQEHEWGNYFTWKGSKANFRRWSRMGLESLVLQRIIRGVKLVYMPYRERDALR